MLKFEVIDREDAKWNRFVLNSDLFDFHHTSYFHKIDSPFPSKLFVASLEDDFIALPVVIRPIEHTNYFDVTSVYGYAGPIYSIRDHNNQESLNNYFQKSIKKFFEDNNIVSVFSRLHPLIDQKRILNGMGDIVDLNKTVSINLTLNADEQRASFRKSLKSELNQLRRKEIFVKETNKVEEIDRFIEIYYETMDRVSASPSYYFSKEYFHEFLNNDEFKSKLLIAEKEGQIIAGAIFTMTPKIMQYHLAGTTSEYIRETPMKLILDEARLIGNASSCENLHLGGGVGGSDDDSLFKFKSAFSKDFHQFSVWKYIVNEEIYNELSKDKIQSNFFPLYRS